jgi:transposase
VDAILWLARTGCQWRHLPDRFHEAGGRGGHTRRAKRTILIEILGPLRAVWVESAKPHDVQSARKFLKAQLDRSTRCCPGSRRS